MKNKLYLIGLISLLTLSGCNINNSTSKTSSKNNSSIESNSSLEIQSGEAEILIEYYYSNGQYFGKNKTKGTIGEKYSINVPKLDFMKADDEVVEFTLGEGGFYQKVIYDYSFEVIKDIEHEQDYSYFMADVEKGISFNYVISGNDSITSPIFVNDIFEIFNHNLKMKELDKYADFNYDSAVKSNYAYDKSLLTNIDNEIYVSISINPDYSIDFYKDGVLNYTFGSSMRPSYNKMANDVYVKDLVENIFEGIEDNGFSIGKGNYKISDLSIGYAINKKEAEALYKKNVHTQIKYVDEFGNEVFEKVSILDNGNTAYSYQSPVLENFICDRDVIEGTTDKSKVETVTYTFKGVEKITDEMKKDKTNVLNRYDTYKWSTNEWYSIAKEISGDFVARVNFHLEGAASRPYSTNGGDCCWRTNLTIIHDAVTNDRYVARLDWHGWMDDVNGDGNHIGTKMNNGTMYLDNYDYDIYNVYNNCNITETITRKGEEVSIDFIIQPNKFGYKNRTYYHSVKLFGVKSEKLNVSFGAEDSIVTFNSIKVLM